MVTKFNIIGTSSDVDVNIPYQPTTQDKIDMLFENFRDFLKEKNRRYGDSVLKPINIFSKSDTQSQIENRLDDKLARIQHEDELKKNDIADVFGYLALLMIRKGYMTFDDLLD